MRLQLNFRSGKPVYQQLVDQIRLAAASGTLRAGESLPGIRPLAEELRINRNTVAKAYAELENQGIIETAAGKGCFVREHNASPFKKDVRRKILGEMMDDVVIHAHHLQIGKDDLLQLAEERFEALRERRERASQRNL